MNMADKIEEIDLGEKISADELQSVLKKEELVEILKNDADDISIRDLMEIYTNMLKEGKYVQRSYHGDYIRFYIKSFSKYLKGLKTDETPYNSYVDMEKLGGTVEHLQKMFEESEKDSSPGSKKILYLTSIYSTFVLEEPIHIVGSQFPGGLKVKKNGETYLCPVKDKQKESPNALCKFCIAEQEEGV